MPDQSDERGSVLLMTVVFILIITVMGLVATQTSVFEIKISENNRQYSEEMAAAEAALNSAIGSFRRLKDDLALPVTRENTSEISHLLNDSRYSDFTTVFYRNDSEVTGSESGFSLAEIEIRRLEKSMDSVPGLTSQANTVPTNLAHRYYSGSIDKRRFAVTSTAYKRQSKIISNTWVQKGISVPVEQDKDLF